MGAVNADMERVRVPLGLGDADKDRGLGLGVEKTEWAEKGLGERVPLVGCHHEQPMATHDLLQLEGLRCFSQWEDQV